MISFVESSEFPDKNEQIKKEWFESAGKIIDKINKLGPKYVNYINGPCIIIGYYLNGSNNLREDMKKYMSTNKKTGIRTEKDIYRYVRLWRKIGT
jgi:hypothetical protein